MKNLLLLLVGFFVTLPTVASANSFYYTNQNSFIYNERIETTFSKLAKPSFVEEKPVKLKIRVESKDAFIGEYDESFYINPTITPYYYPDNNQKYHLPPNPYNYIY